MTYHENVYLATYERWKQFNFIPYGIYIKMPHNYFIKIFNTEILQPYNYIILVFLRNRIHGDRFRFWSQIAIKSDIIKTTSAYVNFFLGVQKTSEVTNFWIRFLAKIEEPILLIEISGTCSLNFWSTGHLGFEFWVPGCRA